MVIPNRDSCGRLQVFDNYAVTVMIGNDPYTLGLFDTAGEFPLLVGRFAPVFLIARDTPNK